VFEGDVHDIPPPVSPSWERMQVGGKPHQSSPHLHPLSPRERGTLADRTVLKANAASLHPHPDPPPSRGRGKDMGHTRPTGRGDEKPTSSISIAAPSHRQVRLAPPLQKYVSAALERVRLPTAVEWQRCLGLATH
jgi:hypothetical protein